MLAQAYLIFAHIYLIRKQIVHRRIYAVCRVKAISYCQLQRLKMKKTTVMLNAREMMSVNNSENERSLPEANILICLLSKL